MGWTHFDFAKNIGFSHLLCEALKEIGFTQHLKYKGREYKAYGTKHYEISLFIRNVPEFARWKPWTISALGIRFNNTLQMVARKAFIYLCQDRMMSLAKTSPRYLPIGKAESTAWNYRLKTLLTEPIEINQPTKVIIVEYLLSLGNLYEI